jgi:hypothetical protein
LRYGAVIRLVEYSLADRAGPLSVYGARKAQDIGALETEDVTE